MPMLSPLHMQTRFLEEVQITLNIALGAASRLRVQCPSETFYNNFANFGVHVAGVELVVGAVGVPNYEGEESRGGGFLLLACLPYLGVWGKSVRKG